MNRAAKPSIGFYSNPSSLGGSEIYLRALIDSLSDESWTIFFFGGDEHPLRSWVRSQANIRFISLGKLGITPVEARSSCLSEHTLRENSDTIALSRALYLKLPEGIRLLLGTIRQIIELRSLFQAHQVDLLHFNDTGCEPATIAARLARVPRVTGTYHVAPAEDSRSLAWVRRAVEWLSVRSLHSGIAVSASTREAWMARVSLESSNIEVIYNGIDVDAYESIGVDRVEFLERNELDTQKRYVVVPARLHWMKGHSVLFAAMAANRQRLADVVFVLLGDGALRQPLEDEVEALGIGDHVYFAGFSHMVADWLSVCDLVVLPSVALEAFPLALLEAMAWRKAIVATDVGGISEMLDGGAAGVVVAPGDAPELAAAVTRCLGDTQFSEQLASAAQERVRSCFSLEKSTDSTREFLRRGLGAEAMVLQSP